MEIPSDKKKHLAAGFAISAVVSLFFGYIVGLSAAIGAGFVKEGYDYITKKGKPEALDLVFTVAGALLFILISVLSSLLFRVF
ncbi:MAG: hypothetical protein IJX55_08780 [Clostridia bacterium]|nr:hypothetical protein [Clostridia bacterium]